MWPTRRRLLSVVGSKTYSLLRSLVAPTLPQDKPLDDLVAILKMHFGPKPLVIAERFHSTSARKLWVGTIIMAELRRLTTHCEFGDYLDEALRDRLVCGLHTKANQRKLLSEAKLTLKRALELAQGMEAAERTAKSLKGRETAVNHLAAKPCYRCGKTSHDHKDHKFRDVDSYNWKTRVHRVRLSIEAEEAQLHGRPPTATTVTPEEAGSTPWCKIHDGQS